MPNYILEGESFFVLNRMDELLDGKKSIFNPQSINNSINLFSDSISVFFDPDKEKCKSIKGNFIICFLDKNVDLRLDYIKNIKSNAVFESYDPIPTTDFETMRKIFPKIKSSNYIPFKKTPMKYKGSKQNYEWFDLNLINDLYRLNDSSVFDNMDAYFDIWSFVECLWSGNLLSLNQVNYINDNNFEDYFNRIRENIKDYIEVFQAKSENYYDHKNKIPKSNITNEFYYNKIKNKILLINEEHIIDALSSFDKCLKNVRDGSNPKIELIKIIFNFKKYAKQ